MIEYELVDSFYSIVGLTDQIVGSYITLVFAFLVAAYLVSSKLDRRMVIVVITLYSYMALRYVAIYYNLTDDMTRLGDRLTELRLQGGTSLDWLVIGDGMAEMHFTQTLAMFLGFLASLFFFFYTRQSSTD